jgi:DNA-binding response OmpR family regulator
VTPRLLVVDDDTSILALLRSYFGGLGWRVEICTQAPDGMSLLDEDPFDAVICDLNLGPGQLGEGFDVISRVRREQPEAAVLLFTAAAGETVRAAALRAGADEVIAKPSPLASLREATLRAMKKS